MAERIFNYEKVGDAYKEIQKIVGDNKNDKETIAGLLYDIDNNFHEYVEQTEMALLGDLGKQLLLDWDNVSSNFDNFVTNFNNWSTLMAQSAGNYKQFENDVMNFRSANPLGATSNGITDSYINTGFYANSYSEDEISELAALAQFHELTGATYVDTGMVSFAGKYKTYNAVTDLLSVVSIAFSGAGIVKAFKAAGPVVSGVTASATASADAAALAMASKSAGGFAAQNLSTAVGGGKLINSGIVSSGIKAAQNAALTTTWYSNFVSSFAKNTVGNSAFWKSVSEGAKASTKLGIAAAGTRFASDLIYMIGSDYDATKYATGYENSNNSVGSTFTVGDSDYVFVGSTDSGTNLFSNENNELFYFDDGGMKNATVIESGGVEKNATLDNIGAEFSMYLGNEVVTHNDSLSSSINVDYDGYYDSISDDILTRNEVSVDNN